MSTFQKGPAPPKKPESKPGPKGDNGEEYFPIEKTKFACVKEFKGTVYVDIREYYEKDGNLLPGKKGMLFSESDSVSVLFVCGVVI